MVDFAPRVAAEVNAAAKPSMRRYYVLGVLTVVYALNFLDRTIFNVLIEPIKKEFALSDTMMGLLAGDIYGDTPIWKSLRAFKATYYVFSTLKLKRSLRALRQRALNIRPDEPERMTAG